MFVNRPFVSDHTFLGCCRGEELAFHFMALMAILFTSGGRKKLHLFTAFVSTLGSFEVIADTLISGNRTACGY